MKPVEITGYHHSVDDAGVNYHGSHSTYPETIGNVSEQGFKTTTGFFKNIAPKTVHGDRNHSSINHDGDEYAVPQSFRASAGKAGRKGSNNPSIHGAHNSIAVPIYNGSSETLPQVKGKIGKKK